MVPEVPVSRGSAHTCHAEGCDVRVPPKLLMCRKHWAMVPRRLQAMVWDVYVPGQEQRMDPTAEYLDVAREAIEAVAVKEGRRPRSTQSTFPGGGF